MRNEVGLILTGVRVLVRLPKIEKMSKGGIALPDYTHDRESKAQLTGILVDAADEAWNYSELGGDGWGIFRPIYRRIVRFLTGEKRTKIKRGDVIFFARYAGAGFEWTTKDIPYRVMNAGDVVGKFEADAPGLDSAFRAAQNPTELYGVEKAA